MNKKIKKSKFFIGLNLILETDSKKAYTYAYILFINL